VISIPSKNSIKQSIGTETVAPVSNSLLMTHQFIANSGETATTETLLNFLYGTNQDFHYQLVLKNDLSLPLYRERNFKFTVMLTDKNGNVVENSNKIPLTLAIYSSENPPKFIDANTAGNKILKGFIEKDLVKGTATFEKIQIKEVTSHFRNGWVFFVVYPKINATGNNNIMMGNNAFTVNSQKIRPLVLEKVVVKAKKAKDKDQGNDGEDRSPDQHDEMSMHDITKEESSS